MKTIKLKGKDYIQVQERVLFFNETYKNGRITTIPTFNGDTVYFKATAVPDVDKPERKFTGHSFGKLNVEKALEKLETVAVGRALAFMGIGIVEGIASADEMDKFHDSVGEQVATNKPADEKVDLAMKGNLLCATCASQVKVSKSGNLYCPKKYDNSDTRNHDNFISRDELGNDPELGYVNKETGEIPTIDEEGNKIPF